MVRFVLLVYCFGMWSMVARALVAPLSSRNSGFVAPSTTRLLLDDDDNEIKANAIRNFVPRSYLVMRKQKASDKRTRRRQRGLVEVDDDFAKGIMTQSPMQERGVWKEKRKVTATRSALAPSPTGGRGRSRKRSNLYASLSSYHDKFLKLLTHEYKAEESEVMDRIRSSIDDPLQLEQKGYAVYDLYPTRRGNLFSDEVYRLEKAKDATTVFASIGGNETSASDPSALPPNHKFSVNDVIVVTKQPQGSGDIFDPSALPISENAMTLEARVSGVGPHYIDIVVGPGAFETAFGQAAPNDSSGKGDRRLRVRADLFFSPIPYQRMVTALAQVTQVPTQVSQSVKAGRDDDRASESNPLDRITMDKVIRDVILSTHAFGDRDSPFFHDPSICNLEEINSLIAKPPMPTSGRLAVHVLDFFQSSPHRFRPLNAPQSAAVQAALTRRLTLIQGPPGSGKTTVAGRIGAGFTRQCQSLSEHTKVLACAFSNVGADNLGEAFLELGLKVVRIGKPSAVSKTLWNNTIDAAISRDVDAQKAIQKAALATASLTKQRSMTNGDDRVARAAATAAVKASIAACNLAATRAFREADIIVSTSTGAADPRLMAACGLSSGSDDDEWQKMSSTTESSRTMAPDGLPPLSLPFVIIDEACQSVEPATLIPIVSSNSCRSLVLLGDPCQLPPTVRHAGSEASPLSVSLMERLSTILQSPNIYSKLDSTVFDTTFLESMPLRQARSLAHSRLKLSDQKSYRKRFAGSFMLSTQYRMHPSISAFPSAIFYDGLLSTPRNLSGMRSFPRVLQSLMPSERENEFNVRLVNIGGKCNEFISDRNVPGEQSTSYSNLIEATYVKDLVDAILQDKNGDVQSIAVVTPYSAQVQLIESLLKQNSSLAEGSNSTSVEISSVDAFQGRERDVILFSSVRSNRDGRIGFLGDWRRLNVALTRARKALVLVGDFDTLAPADGHWAALYKWGEGEDCVFQVEV